MRIAARAALSVVFCLIISWPSAWAQQSSRFPTKPVRLMVPYAPGGATDITARALADRLKEHWGQPVIVDNRPGASGNIALELMAQAPADGYTLFVGNVSTNAINESIFRTLKTRPSRDLTGVTNLIELPHLWIVSPQIPVSSLKELVAHVKKTGARLNYASAGVGSYPHLDALLFLNAAGIEMTHVPYKGGAAQMVPSVMGNETQFMFVNVASTLSQIRANRLKPLATSWPTRLPELPEVPTVTESGFPGMGTNAWNGLFAPARITAPVLNRIHADVLTVMQSSAMKDALAKVMMSAVVNKSPAEYQAFVQQQTQKWAKVVRDNNITAE
ncbi:MAG TPA: tripartite tricarboxylate transporter substrate binding protein [Burkholderiales bacterium]|nr:tripartite tricarboxylate transporter substrate binding protein [Burkholderiales bacterium]